MSKGTLFVVSAPSGAGKTTILKRIMATVPRLVFSVSHTTRKPRQGERDGIDYHFIDRSAFLDLRDNGAFLEWAEVHGNLYGTSRQAVQATLASGTDILLDIDVQGARQVRAAKGLAAVFLFIAPPSWEELEKRLKGRGTDDEATIGLRLANARQEVAEAGLYDCVIVNDTVDKAVDSLRAVIVTERCRSRRTAAGEPFSLSSSGS